MTQNPKYIEALGRAAIRFNGMDQREIEIYLAGQEDGANIKADMDQVILSGLEEQLAEAQGSAEAV
jgi:hypothetical protein